MALEPSVSLRDVIDSDIETFYRHQAEKPASEMAAFPIRTRGAHFKEWERRRADSSITMRTIMLGADVAGNIVSWNQDGKREVGYWLGMDHWGKGIATVALQLFLEVEPARPLFAYAAEANLASQRVLDKCGFAASGNTIDGGTAQLREYVLTS